MSEKLFARHKTAQQCPQCGALLQIKRGKQGLFLGCSAYPNCDYLHTLQPVNIGQVLKVLPEKCPECEHSLVLRQGQFGMFIGCSHYPDCHFIVQEQENVDSHTQITCPHCKQGSLVARRGGRGRTFYGCNRFPACRFTLDKMPIEKPCPVCHYPISFLKKSEKEACYQCANRACKHEFRESNEE